MKFLKKPQIRSLLYTIPLGLLLASCARNCTESALSDVVLTQPELLIVEMTLEKEIGRSPRHQARIWVRDKNQQALSIKEGGVSVNGQNVSVSKSTVGNLPVYKAGNGRISIDGGKDYDIEVQLGDGSTYSTRLTLPSKTLSRFNVPGLHDSQGPLVVSWDQIDPSYETVLSWTKIIPSDSSTTISSDYMVIKNKTSHTFPPDFFWEGGRKVERVDFDIESKLYGEPNSAFRSESFIKCIIQGKGSVEIDPPSS